MVICPSFSCQLGINLRNLGRASVEELTRLEWTMGMSGGVFLIANRRGRRQLVVGGAIPRQVGLAFVRKVAEQALESKPGNQVPLRSSSRCLHPGPHLDFLQ